MSAFTAKPILTGELVSLRPVSIADVPRLQELMADPEVSRLTGSVHSSTEVAGDEYALDELVEIYGRWAEARDRIVWVVIDNASGEIVGESVLNDLDEGNLSCGFRIWLAGGRDRGLGTEAVRLSVAHAFAVGLNRVELEVYAFNPRARRVYEKVGFTLEGTKRQALRFDAGWIDAHLMAILAGEWPG